MLTATHGYADNSVDTTRRSFVYSEAEKAEHERMLHAQKEAQIEAIKQEGQRSVPADYSSRSVGEIPIQEGISPSGARTYNIPIPTAAGFKLVPSVSLAYNSQASEGWVGHGWDIQGISSINLIPHNKYYHNNAKGANVYHTDPALSLDGIPLVTNTQPGTMSQYPLITATGNILASVTYNQSGYIARITALFPNGITAVYGFDANVSHNLHTYPVTEMTDLDGNRISFVYQADTNNGNSRLDAIRYGYDSAGDYHAEITFSYDYLTAFFSRYYAGQWTNRISRLNGIVSKDGNAVICSYPISYEQRDNVYLLNKVECISGSDTLRPLRFEYGELVPNPNPEPDCLYKADSLWLTSAFVDDVDYVYRRGKFINRSYNDGLIIYPNKTNYDVTFAQKRWGQWSYRFGSPYVSDQVIIFVASLKDGASPYVNLTTGSGFQTIEAVDVDGDGIDELVKVNLNGTSGSNSKLLITVFKCNSSGTPVQNSQFEVLLNGTITSGSFTSPYRRDYFWGDFLGNGKTQLLAVAYDKNYNSRQNYNQTSYATLIDIATQTIKCESQLFTFPLNGTRRLIPCDLDNDNVTELCYATDSGLDVYQYSSNAFVLDETLGGITASALTYDARPYYITDINCDGYIDIMVAPEAGYGASWTRYAYNGATITTFYPQICQRTADDTFMFIDVNRDGYADLVKANGTSLGVHMNLESGQFSPFMASSSAISNTKGFVPANIVDRFGTSAFIKVDGHYVHVFNYSSFSPELRQLIKSIDSHGKVLINNYVYLPEHSRHWTDPGASVNNANGYAFRTLPIYVLQGADYFCDEALDEQYSDMSYSYHDGVIHNWGLGFCGFSKTLSFECRNFHDPSSWYNVSTTETHNPQKRGVVTSVVVYDGRADSRVSRVTNTYDDNTTTYGKLNPRLTQSVALDSLTGITTTTSYTYGSYDLPTSIVTSQRIGSGTAQTQTLDREYQNSVTPTKYVLGAVTEETLTTEADAYSFDSWQTKTVNAYDSNFHRTSSKEYAGPLFSHNRVSETRWTYDAHGNPTSEKVAHYESTTFVGDTLVYDSAGRYLTSRTDALGRTTTYSGYNKFGKPTAVTDYHNHTTTFTYDSWGNLVSTCRPDGGVEQTTIAWGGDGLYAVTNTATGTPETVTHYDALGRELKSGVKRFDGQWQWTMKEYDSRGRLHRVSLPYRGTGPSYWNRYHYDLYDRPDSLIEASGRTSTWSYSGTSTTTVRDDIETTRTTDAMGRVVSVTDAAGTVTYNLRDDGQPRFVSVLGNTVATFTYDDFGRRTQMADVSLGTETDSYTWRANGSCQHTHTNRYGTANIIHDQYGRLTQDWRLMELTSNYSYDSDGRLSSVQSSNNTGTEYTYDSFDRISTVKETVPDGKWLMKTYTYGTGSVLSGIQYSNQDGVITTETYSYANGHNTGITLPGNITVWSLTSENDLGQPTEIITGTMDREYGYTQYGIPTYRRMDEGYVQDITCQFDPMNGNLLSRSGYLSGGTQTFSYDQLNRLHSITLGNSTRNIQYSLNGNITSVDGVGTLIYGGGTGVSPYEVTGLTPEQGQPPYRQRTVTYNSYERPKTLTEGTKSATFTYNAAGDRVKMEVTDSQTGPVMTRWYAGDCYEYESSGGTTVERLYLGGNAYSAPVVLQRTGSGSWTFYNICRDHLGSVTAVSAAGGGIIALYRYDPWGRLVDNTTGVPYTPGSEPSLWFGRGFTGHEFLPWFGLFNANARLYDPLLGRFLSPDPYVQDPDFSQNYNRYSYCLNNPLKYTDESGEIIGTLLTAVLGFPIAFAYGGLLAPIVSLFDLQLGNKMTNDAWSIYSQKVSNAWKIDMAPFQTDENLSSGEQIWSVVSRFTWEFSQTVAGNTISHIRNIFGVVDISYYHGATLVNTTNTTNKWSGMTLGSYINGKNLTKDPQNNDVFAHEFGHTRQSALLGPLYLSLVGLPSLSGSVSDKFGWSDHNREWYEVWANQLSYNYHDHYGYSKIVSNWSARNPLTQNPDWFIYPTIARYFRLAFALFACFI